MRLTENFTLAEAVKSQTATRMGISNSPPPEVLERMIETAAAILEPVRSQFGAPVFINSFYRSPELNRAIGSRPGSQHVTGEAVDFEVAGIPNAEVAAWIRDNLDFDQCILEFASKADPQAGWVHASYKSNVAACRYQCLTINEDGTFEGILA